MTLDLGTLLVAMMATGVIGALAITYSHGRSNALGELWWSGSLLLEALGMLFLLLQTQAHTVLAYLLPNAVICGAFALKYLSLTRFFRLEPSRVVVAAPVLLVVFAFPFLLDQRALRIVTVAIACLIPLTYSARLIFKSRLTQTMRSVHLLVVTIGLALALFVFRGLHALIYVSDANSLLETGTPYAVAQLGFLLVGMLSTYTVLLMYNERLSSDVERLATIDPLTNIYNRRAFIAAAERELARGERSGRFPCLLMLDIDHFKQVNDTYGHLTGDLVLIQMTQKLQEALRDQDVLARFGGEEFSILLPETDRAGGIVSAERLRSAVASLVCRANRHTLRITVSVGIAIARPGDTLDDLVTRADRALYDAKGAGRNCVKIEPLP